MSQEVQFSLTVKESKNILHARSCLFWLTSTLGIVLLGMLMLPKELGSCVCRYKRLSRELLTYLLEQGRTRLLVSSVVVYLLAIFIMHLEMEAFSVLQSFQPRQCYSLTVFRFPISLMPFSFVRGPVVGLYRITE